MVIGNRKEEGRVCTVLFLGLEKKAPSENRFKKAKSALGFKPGLHGQKATALSLLHCKFALQCKALLYEHWSLAALDMGVKPS